MRNPLPAINTLSPANTQAEGASFALTVNGSNFVNGAKVLWNGLEVPTTFGNNSQLTAQIDATKIRQGQLVNISVLNPDPDAQVSPTALFDVQPKLNDGGGTNKNVYLPLVQK